MGIRAVKCCYGGWKNNQTAVGVSVSRFNVCMLHSEERYPAVVTAGDSWWSWLLFCMSVSGDKRQQVCVCVQFQPSEKEKKVCWFSFLYIYIRLHTHTWRSKSVLFYAFMRMYSVLDCRQCKEENIQSVSYCSNGSSLQPTNIDSHTSVAFLHTQMPLEWTDAKPVALTEKVCLFSPALAGLR